MTFQKRIIFCKITKITQYYKMRFLFSPLLYVRKCKNMFLPDLTG